MTSVQLCGVAKAKIRSNFTDGERRAATCSLAVSVTSTYHSIKLIRRLYGCFSSLFTHAEEETQVRNYLL